jgi:hypothetical protein
MLQKDPVQIKEKILRFISEKGPSLPVQISSSIGMSMLFASAFLSELLSERKLKMTYMRVGSSPVYFTEGQEQGLEKYATYLKSKEKEAYELLRAHSFLVDSEQLPAIRVALRAIKDFAVPSLNQEIWRYFLIKEDYQKNPSPIKEEKIIEPEEEIKKEEKEEKISKEEIKVTEEKNILIEETENNNLDFTQKVKNKLIKLNVKVIEQTETKKKELYWIGRIETHLGEIEILIVGKDKKSISDKDLEKLFNEVTEKKKIILFLSTGEITKKTKETYREYKNTILFEKID